MRKILSWGVTDEMAENLVTKVKLSNILSVALIVLLVFYSIISIFLIPELLPYCIAALVIYVMVLLINKSGAITLGRLLLSVAPIIVISTLHAVAIGVEEEKIMPILYFQYAALVLPFAVFGKDEFAYLGTSFIINILVFLNFDRINALIEIEDMNNTFFQSPFIGHLVLGGAISLSAFMIFFLQFLSEKQAYKNKELLSRINDENQKALEKENDLKKTLSELEASQIEERKRNWATEGVAKVASILRASDNFADMADAIIAFVVKYMESNQGALFIYKDDEGEDPHLELASCYAYDRKKFVEKRVELGQGLVGQCYREGDYIYLTEVPASYVNITSGLGDATPTAILLVPLKVNEQIYGIFELASFKRYESHQIEFLQQLGENIAMTLNNIRANEKTKKLLEESQQSQEQMRAQEEEMRQNMEEMQATQENQHRLQEELDEKQKQLQLKLESAKVLNQVLDKLRRSRKIVSGNLYEGIKEITETITDAMHVSRASIWAYHDGDQKISCLDLHEADTKAHSSGTELSKKDFPAYFKAIENEQIINAANARNHQDTLDFTEVYFKPLDIYSLLDVPFFAAGKLGGVICLENQHQIKNWTPEEVTFITSVCDILTILYQNHQITQK